MLSLTLTHSLTHTYSLSLLPPLWLCQSLILQLCCPSHFHFRSLSRSLSPSLTHSLIQSLSLTHLSTLFLARSHSLTLTISLSLSFPYSLGCRDRGNPDRLVETVAPDLSRGSVLSGGSKGLHEWSGGTGVIRVADGDAWRTPVGSSTTFLVKLKGLFLGYRF